jgi:hypothetical protein
LKLSYLSLRLNDFAPLKIILVMYWIYNVVDIYLATLSKPVTCSFLLNSGHICVSCVAVWDRNDSQLCCRCDVLKDLLSFLVWWFDAYHCSYECFVERLSINFRDWVC